MVKTKMVKKFLAKMTMKILTIMVKKEKKIMMDSLTRS